MGLGGRACAKAAPYPPTAHVIVAITGSSSEQVLAIDFTILTFYNGAPLVVSKYPSEKEGEGRRRGLVLV